MAALNGVMAGMGGLVGLWGATKVIPVMYKWEMIPGVVSPEWQAKADKINYHHYTEGIVYSPYDAGEPISQMPTECQGQMYLKQKTGGWKWQYKM